MSEKPKICKKCANSGHCQLGTHEYMLPLLASGCDGYCPEHKPTNGDILRQMSNEELATWIIENGSDCVGQRDDCHTYKCKMCWIDWLDKEAEE